MDRIPCLYFPTQHLIKADQWELHMKYCRQYNWKGDDWKTCPFNRIHLIPEPEFDYHLEHCQDRFLVESFTSQLTVLNQQKLHANVSAINIADQTQASFEELVKPTANETRECVRKNQISTISSANDLFVTMKIPD